MKRASTAQRRALRGAFVENVLSIITVLEFSIFVARTHERMVVALSKNLIAGARCGDRSDCNTLSICGADAKHSRFQDVRRFKS